MRCFGRSNVLLVLFLLFVLAKCGVEAKEFGFLAGDPKFPGTGPVTDSGFMFSTGYPDPYMDQRVHGEVLDPCFGFDTLWWEACYIPLPSRDSIVAHNNTYPATDSEVADMLLYITKEFSADGFTLIVQMEGGKTFAAVDNDLFKRLGLGGTHQTDDSSDAVVSFPVPDHPIITGIASPPLWGQLHSFTWKGVGRLDKLDPKMECLATDANGQCVFAGVEKGVIAPNDGGIFFVLDTKILSQFATNDTNECLLWGNLCDYAINDQYKHYVFVPTALHHSISPARPENLAIVNNRLQLSVMGPGEKSISITDLSGRVLLNAKESGATFTLPRLNRSGMILISVENNGKKEVLPCLIQ